MTTLKGRTLALFSEANMRSMKGMILLSFQRVFQKSLGLISTYFLVRALTQEEFGQYSFVIGVIGTVSIFSLSGLKNAILQSVARGFLGTYRSALPYSFYSGLIGSYFLTLISLWYFQDHQHSLSGAFAIAALFFPFTEGLTQWRSVVIGKENFKGYFKLDTLGLSVLHFTMVASVVFFPHLIFVPLLVYLGIPTLQNIIMTLWDLSKISPTAPSEPQSIAYGIKTSFYSAFITISVNADKLLLFMFLPASSLAVFVAAERIPELLRNFVSDGVAVMAPRFAREKVYTRELDNNLKKISIAIGLGVTLFSFTLLPYLVTVIFGEIYGESVFYAQILTLSVAFGNAATLRFRFIRSQLDTKNFARITIITSVLRIIMSALFIPAFGIMGAVASAFAYRIIMALTVDWVIRKNYLSVSQGPDIIPIEQEFNDDTAN